MLRLAQAQKRRRAWGGHPTFFTLYDLNGLIAGSETQPSGFWTPTEQLIGITPAGVAPADNPSVLNITWSYSGPLITDGNITSTNLGNFTFLSSFGGTSGLTAFSQQATKNNPLHPDDDTRIAGLGEIVGPAVSSTVPEPRSLLLLGSGLLGLASFTKRKL
jgi:PEP-CTERM motif